MYSRKRSGTKIQELKKSRRKTISYKALTLILTLEVEKSLTKPMKRQLCSQQDPHGNGIASVGFSRHCKYSCLENSMGRGAWWATVHRAAKSQTPLNDRACKHTRGNI